MDYLISLFTITSHKETAIDREIAYMKAFIDTYPVEFRKNGEYLNAKTIHERLSNGSFNNLGGRYIVLHDGNLWAKAYDDISNIPNELFEDGRSAAYMVPVDDISSSSPLLLRK